MISRSHLGFNLFNLNKDSNGVIRSFLNSFTCSVVAMLNYFYASSRNIDSQAVNCLSNHAKLLIFLAEFL